ncbi:MAG: DUF697 domain-containing protein [Desulfuromonadaceae bacterium]|nr:DUF697 domain-containing protein [Desulfuromonadaceae bacterium]
METAEEKPVNQVVIAPPAERHSSEQTEMLALRAENCIKNHVIAAMSIGLIPSALLDVVGITAIEVKMIRDLAGIYDFPVPHKLVAYKVLISLIGSIGPVYISTKMHSALKGVPLVGHAVYVGLLSLTGGAAVYAVGKIFQMHYESDGTFLSKDNKYIREYFKEKYAEGKQVVKGYVL